MFTKYSLQTTALTRDITSQSAESFRRIFERHFETPAILIEKTRAKTFIPAAFRDLARSDTNIDTSSMLIFDVDQKLGAGYDEEMITLEETEDALRDLNLEHFIYTSHSHSLVAPRFRIVIAASRPFYPVEHNVICAAMLEELDEFFNGRLLPVVDACWKVPSQCYFVYTVHPERRDQAISLYNPGKPADIDDLKLRQSNYGLETECKPGAARAATGRTGETGRSYDLNRILGGMFTSSTEEEIAQRLFEHDNTAHAGNEYFRDPQYPRNRPRPGETQEAAAWRSCKLFTKSHLNSLKRKCRKQVDLKVVRAKAQSKDPMPTHDAMIKFRSVKSQPTSKGAETVLIELQVMSGEHAGRHFWHRLYGKGSAEVSIKISNSLKDKIAKATKTDMKDLMDAIKAEGKVVRARIKYKPGTNGYPAQNEIGDIHLNV